VITTQHNQIKYLNYETCTNVPLPLLYLLSPDDYILKQTVQSHRGTQSIGHSMTYDPSITMVDLQQKY
jgi:hypothetical protein